MSNTPTLRVHVNPTQKTKLQRVPDTTSRVGPHTRVDLQVHLFLDEGSSECNNRLK